MLDKNTKLIIVLVVVLVAVWLVVGNTTPTTGKVTRTAANTEKSETAVGPKAPIPTPLPTSPPIYNIDDTEFTQKPDWVNIDDTPFTEPNVGIQESGLTEP